MDKAAEIIRKNIYAAVATCDLNGQPWNSPVYVVYDERLNFYWASGKDSQHSRNIQANPKVFFVIYDSSAPWGTGEGFFVEAEVLEVDDPDEIAKVCDLRKKRVTNAKHVSIDDFSGDRPRRIYCAAPKRAWVNRDGNVNGHFVDERAEIDLVGLTRFLASA